MIPVFCAEVFTEVTTATFDVTWSGSGFPFSVSWDVPAGLFWLGGLSYPGSPSLGDAFADELESADPNIGIPNWSYSVQSLSPNVGAVGRLSRFTAPSAPTVTATNAAAEHVLWSLGFRASSSVVMTSSTGFPVVSRYAETDGVPFATWWPQGYLLDELNFTPMSAMVNTSRRPGSGTSVSWSRQDDRTEERQWRSFTVNQVASARVKRRRALDSAWAAIAGLTSNPQDSALDNPDWWWARTCDGSHRYAVIEDQSVLVTGTPKFSIYQTIYDDDCPVSMDGWTGLRSPNVTQEGSRNTQAQFVVNWCAAFVDEGNL